MSLPSPSRIRVFVHIRRRRTRCPVASHIFINRCRVQHTLSKTVSHCGTQYDLAMSGSLPAQALLYPILHTKLPMQSVSALQCPWHRAQMAATARFKFRRIVVHRHEFRRAHPGVKLQSSAHSFVASSFLATAFPNRNRYGCSRSAKTADPRCRFPVLAPCQPFPPRK